MTLDCIPASAACFENESSDLFFSPPLCILKHQMHTRASVEEVVRVVGQGQSTSASSDSRQRQY